MNYNFGLLAFLALLSFAIAADDKTKCAGGTTLVENYDTNWRDNMLIDAQPVKSENRPCANKIREQIQVEVSASIFYLSLGAYFSQDDVNRPGFAKFFLDSAKEEREHAAHLIDYLTMRGETKLDTVIDGVMRNVIQMPQPDTARLVVTKSGKNALQEALTKELAVTASIKSVIQACELQANEHPNDYHLVDYLTGVYLEEQYKGQRDLAGKIATLSKLMLDHKDLGEYMFDKTLL